MGGKPWIIVVEAQATEPLTAPRVERRTADSRPRAAFRQGRAQHRPPGHDLASAARDWVVADRHVVGAELGQPSDARRLSGCRDDSRVSRTIG